MRQQYDEKIFRLSIQMCTSILAGGFTFNWPHHISPETKFFHKSFPFFQSSAPNSGEKNLFLEEISWHAIILLPYNFASLDIFQLSSKSFFFLSHHCINSIYYGLVFIKMSFNQLYKKAFVFQYYKLVNISMSPILWSSEIDQIFIRYSTI